MSVHPFSFNSSRYDDWTFIKFDSGEFHQSVSMTAIVGYICTTSNSKYLSDISLKKQNA